MNRQILASYFTGVCAKRLSAVEVNKTKSNQHEFNSTRQLKYLLGNAEPFSFKTRFIYLDDTSDPLEDEGELTWYDARRDTPSRSEYRLYYPSNTVTKLAREGDLLVFAKQPDNTLFAIIATNGSVVENQLLWLFDLPEDLDKKFTFEDTAKIQKSDIVTRMIFDSLGIVIEEETTDIDLILSRFGNSFPTTREFSNFAREPFPSLNDHQNEDAALIAWMNREEHLFRQLEKYIVSERLKQGFVDNTGVDIDGFISFSLSVQNRRKSRVGFAFENHLEEIFIQSSISYTRGAVTERREKPDFIFPNIESYKSNKFPPELLSMLAVKSTCKDRWRQVLTEAEKIPNKHLITLEPAISEHQTDQMKAANLQLVLPHEIQESYRPAQQKWLVSLEEFVDLLHRKKTHLSGAL